MASRSIGGASLAAGGVTTLRGLVHTRSKAQSHKKDSQSQKKKTQLVLSGSKTQSPKKRLYSHTLTRVKDLAYHNMVSSS